MSDSSRKPSASLDQLRILIQEGLDDLKAGRTVDGDEVMRWIESWGTGSELPPPTRLTAPPAHSPDKSY